MRTLVLVAGVLLLAALVLFLAVGKWKNPFNRRDLPERLGMEIEEQANGVTYTQTRGGRTLFKIHASRVVELKQGNALLHDVRIELYGTDGKSLDRIEGNEFEYDQSSGMATAAGPVEIWLTRPGMAAPVAPQAVGGKPKTGAATTAAARGAIHVKTSGLTFNQKSGVAATGQPVKFSMAEGGGSSLGATYDSQRGILVLDRAVELTTHRGAQVVQVHAQHAEFERDSRILHLRAATADSEEGEATAGEADILFREDGSAVRLNAAEGFTLRNATGNSLRAPTGELEFDARNQPRSGHLEGGVVMDSASGAGGQRRQSHGTAPTAKLEFTARGELESVHLERGVTLESEDESEVSGQPQRLRRGWRSPVADIDFRASGQGGIEPAVARGTGGVTVTSESRLGQKAAVLSRLSADALTAEFAPGSRPAGQGLTVTPPGPVLTKVTGVGRASIEETTATGVRESASGDRLEAHFAPPAGPGAKPGARGATGNEAQVESATIEGHVRLAETPAARPGAPAPATLTATADRADYAGAGQWLHLIGSPRVEDGALELTAGRIDVSRTTGDAFAHGDVKASWADAGAGGNGAGGVALGGRGPVHAVAAEAELSQASGQTTFRGRARLWQQGNSVAAPVIVIDRRPQTLTARSGNAAEPVRVVLFSAAVPSGTEMGPGPGREPEKTERPTVIRVRGGDLKYSDAEHKVVMRGGALREVVTETEDAASVSDEVEVTLKPPAKASGHESWQGQVDRMTARGHVVLTSGERRGTGEQLVYAGATGLYVLTGTAAAPPRMTDPERGTVTGETLIFNGRDDSVRVEGGGEKTRTETTAPRGAASLP